MKLSILTPAIWSRQELAAKLAAKVASQIDGAKAAGLVEHLSLFDNRARSIGAKRQALIESARGDYVAFVDDDDDILPEYVRSLVNATCSEADVVTFKQDAYYNGAHSTVIFSATHQDEAFNPGGITKRAPWHSCAWRRAAVSGCLFGESNYGEDLVWCLQARKRCRSELHIDKVLHVYRHDERTTAAPAP